MKRIGDHIVNIIMVVTSNLEQTSSKGILSGDN